MLLRLRRLVAAWLLLVAPLWWWCVWPVAVVVGVPKVPAPAPLGEFDGEMVLPEKVQRFLLFTTQRAGTGWTMHKFQSRAPMIRAEANEPMQGLMKQYSRSEQKRLSWETFELYLNKTFQRRCGMLGWNPGEVACGFKFMYNQLPAHFGFKQLFKYCSQHDIVIIHLVRNNVVRHLISRANHKRDMDELGNRQDPHPRTVATPRKIKLNVKDKNITNVLNNVNDARAALMAHMPGRHLEVQYESLVRSDRQCRAMFAFLNPALASLPCNDVDGDAAIKKQHDGHPCSFWVTNWNEVVDLLKGYKSRHPMLMTLVQYWEHDCALND